MRAQRLGPCIGSRGGSAPAPSADTAGARGGSCCRCPCGACGYPGGPFGPCGPTCPVGMSSLRSARREASAARASSSRVARADWLPLFTPLLLLVLLLGASSTAALAGAGAAAGAGMLTGATEREPELPGMRGSWREESRALGPAGETWAPRPASTGAAWAPG